MICSAECRFLAMFSCLPKCVYSAILSHKEWTSFWGAGQIAESITFRVEKSNSAAATIDTSKYEHRHANKSNSLQRFMSNSNYMKLEPLFKQRILLML